MLITLLKSHFRLNNINSAFLLHKFCFLTFLFAFLLLLRPDKLYSQENYRLVFWNVENLFDTYDDTTSNDDAFTPQGENHWTYTRYKTKLNHISQTIVAMCTKTGSHLEAPVLIGMAEVENDKVLYDLTNGTSLRKFDYGFVHYDSPDPRGIDNALLYRRDCFFPFLSQAVSVSDSSNGFMTRDLLLVEGCTATGDTLIAIVSHFPSKRGGMAADKRRLETAQKLRNVMDTVANAHPSAAVVVMGDFNASPDEQEIKNGLASDDGTFVNLMKYITPGSGSYKYQDQWSCLDQIIVSRNLILKGYCNLHLCEGIAKIYEGAFLLLDDEKYMGKKVFRTYLGMKYQGGYSDHLPVYIDILHVKNK